MSSTTFVGKPDVMVGGPPPPPPPPPVPNQLPTMRINTVENTAARRPQIASNDAYEPPAAIQNAMLTKDKKPFTYTPGMGGKLDLSQIRSPRMARRVAKNANDEGIEGPPKSAVESKPSTGTSTTPNLMVQPQVAIPVLPVNVAAAPHINRAPQPPVNRTPSNTLEKQVETPKIITKVDIKAVPVTVSSSQSSTPESPSTPTQVTLAKAPTPWLQNKNKPQENLPEWAKRTTVNKAANGSPVAENANSPTTIYVQVQPTNPQSPPAKMKQEQERHPIPRDQCQQPFKVQQLPQQRQEPQQKQNIAVSSHQTNPNRHERVVPIRIEDRPSVFDVNRESGHHQFKQPSTLHHQQRWGQVPAQQHTKNQAQNRSQNQEQSDIHVAAVSQPVQSQPTTTTTYIIPMVVEGDRKTTPSNTGYNTAEKGRRVVQQHGSAPNTPPIQQNEPGPIQSRSFRVLQKITDTDGSDNVGTEQIRKLDLSEDDRLLMNKFKEQVDQETYLHQEEDPRYRGAAIPSRAFRFLQNMTESNDAVTCTAPRNPQNITNKRQNRNSKSFEETQTNLPPSEQQVQEPKKYMGSAIPSRSFKILQAMTTPESIATQENRRADYTCRTENNPPGNQQDVFLLSRPVPPWYPETRWCCYAVQHGDPSTEQSANNTHQHFPLPPYARSGYSDRAAHIEHESYSPFRGNDARYSQGNDVQRSHIDGDDAIYRSATDSSHTRNDRHFARNSTTDNGSENAVPLEQTDHLVDRSSGSSSKNANENYDNDRNCFATNAVGEEGVALGSAINDEAVPSNGKTSDETTFDPRVNAPTYAYAESGDSDDSSDSSSDSSSFISSNKPLSDSCRKIRSRSDTTFDNTSSDSDSDSYVAYSTGLNYCENLHAPSEHSSADNNCKSDFDACSDSCESSQRDREQREPTTGSAVSRHQANAIDCDTERSDSRNRENERNPDDKRKEVSLEAADDLSDDDVETMVSVSLPLRFNFSVSEDNEDVTTVTIGDSRIRAERSCGSRRKHPDKASDDCADNDTSVKFTVKRYVSDAVDAASGKETAVPCVDFTLRKDPPARINEEDNGEQQRDAKIEFASDEESERGDLAESVSKEVENCAASGSEIIGEDILARDERNRRVRRTGDTSENATRTIRESKASETFEWIQGNFEAPRVQVIDANQARDNNDDSASVNGNDSRVDLEVDQTHATRHLLSVRDSHDDTDDEDSGVTSDISRMISEVDTDSECASSRTSKKYQRTQTHSRLFRLLNDDDVASDYFAMNDFSPRGREYPSSPLLDADAFAHDDYYCLNYSNGLSPEYPSSARERSWRRSCDATNAASPNIIRLDHPSKHVPPARDDPHPRPTWRNSKLPDSDNVVPSLAYKILDSKMPSWAYKVNVLCPRIKSAKDVPQALLARPMGNNNDNPSPLILTVPTSRAHSKTK